MLPPLDLLTRTYHLYKKHLWLYLGYAAWLLVPFAAFVVLRLSPDHLATTAAEVVASILEIFLAIWITVIYIKITTAIARRKPLDLQKVQRDAFNLITSSVRIILLQLVIFLGGLILLIIPGLVFAIWFAFSQQALVIDGKKDLDALSTSKELLKGQFFRVLWRLLLGPVAIAFVYSALVGSVITIIALVFGIDPVTIYESDTLPLWVEIFEVIGEMFFVPLFAIYITLLYLHLKQLATSKQTA